jgi:protease I
MHDNAKGEVNSKKILAGRKVAVLVESEFIPDEIKAYRKRFAELGAKVDFISRLWSKEPDPFVPNVRDPNPNPEELSRPRDKDRHRFFSDVDKLGKPMEVLRVNRDFRDCKVSDYAAIIMAANYTSVRLRMFDTLPGQRVDPEQCKEAPAVKFFAQAMKDEKIIKGALCHGLWILSPRKDLIQGRHVICHEVMVADVLNMGAKYVYEEDGVVVDADLVTGRAGEDVYVFIDKIAQQVEKVANGERLEPYATQSR